MIRPAVTLIWKLFAEKEEILQKEVTRMLNQQVCKTLVNNNKPLQFVSVYSVSLTCCLLQGDICGPEDRQEETFLGTRQFSSRCIVNKLVGSSSAFI